MARTSREKLAILTCFLLSILLLIISIATDGYPSDIITATATLGVLLSGLFWQRTVGRLRNRIDSRTAKIVEERDRLQSQQQALLKLATTPSCHAKDMIHTIQNLLETTTETLDAERAAFWILDRAAATLRCYCSYERGTKQHTRGQTITNSSCPKFFEALRNNRVVVLHDITSSPYALELINTLEHGVTSAIDASVYHHGELFGLVRVSHIGPPRIWAVDEQHFTGSIADMVALAIQASDSEMVREELEQKSLAIEASMDGMAILDSEQLYTYVNRAHAQVYGYEDPNELIGKSWRALYSEKEVNRFEEQLMPALSTAGKLRVEATGKRKDGTLFPQEISLTALEGGGLICVVHDISDRRATELKAQQMALFASLSPAPILRFDLDGNITSANPAACDIFSKSDLQGIGVQSLIQGAQEVDLVACITDGKQVTCSSKIGERYFQFIFRGVPDLRFGHIYGSDITDFKLAHQRLVDSRRFLRKVIDSDPNLIFVKDEQGRFTLANQALAELYGTDVNDILWKTDADFLPITEQVAAFQQREQEVIITGRELAASQEQLTDAHGKQHLLQIARRPLTLNHNGAIHVLGVATDITETKQLQEELLQSQKMDAIGQLAGGIAHDFNNLLTGIIGCTGLLKMSNERLPDVLSAAETIENAAHRAGQLTQKLLGFARKGKHQNVAVDVHASISESLALLRRTIEKNISIVERLEAPFSIVLGDPTQIQQIILNLAINARDAMSADIDGSDGGELKICTKVISPVDLQINHPTSEVGNFLHLMISDTGCGMAEEVQEKIFEPFFTTKPTGRGTGMGLAMVYGIVKSHDGFIKVDSKVGHGTTFNLYFPVHEGSANSDRSSDSSRAITGQGQILVVDDHNIVRSITCKMLRSLGYGVATARDGLEALDYYRRYWRDIDLVIIDMIMPRMGARECFRELKIINPKVLAILSTGYVNNHAVQDILNEGMRGFIQKPYQLAQLSEVVAQVLESQIAAVGTYVSPHIKKDLASRGLEI